MYYVISLFLSPDITEIGRCAKSYCEHTARSNPTLPDAVVTLIEMGTKQLQITKSSMIDINFMP